MFVSDDGGCPGMRSPPGDIVCAPAHRDKYGGGNVIGEAGWSCAHMHLSGNCAACITHTYPSASAMGCS
jgi:hypothetical protein